MSVLINTLDAYLPACLATVALVTAILAAGLAISRMVRRSPAVRHAVLLWSFIAVALCPLFMIAVRLAGNPAPWTIRKTSLSFLPAFPGSTGALEATGSGGQRPGTGHPPFGGMLVALWGAGSAFSLLGVVHGLRATRLLRRGAYPISADKMAHAVPQLTATFGPKLSEILISERVAVPVTTGYRRPVVLLPSSLLSRIDEQQLLQVLVHECAHAARRDTLTALYQRALAALFWFHPLVHLAGRRLNAAREEICDNYVLRAVPAGEYAQTLLTIAEGISPVRSAWFAPALVQRESLESRIANLLDPRRCTMISLTSKKLAAIALAFLGGVIVLSCFAGAAAPRQDSAPDFSHVVNLEPTTGDYIKIVEVRGPSDTLAVGNTYEVRGTYKLVSQEKALLMVSVSTEAGQPHESHPQLAKQKMVVEKGEGSYVLQFHMWHEGRPHVSFYPLPRGNGFASRNF